MTTPFDPKLSSIHSIANDDTLLDPSRLSVDYLRYRFQSDFTLQPETAEESTLHRHTPFIPASVLLPIVMREHGPQVILTPRAANLQHHAGQISFPGGRVDKTDISAEHTAIRETNEEIGIDVEKIEPLGQLAPYFTGTGFVINPVVALVHPPFTLCADPVEVASIFEVPLAFLMNPQNHQRRQIDLPNGGGRRIFYVILYEEYFIWGATAGMLRNLFHFLNA